MLLLEYLLTIAFQSKIIFCPVTIVYGLRHRLFFDNGSLQICSEIYVYSQKKMIAFFVCVQRSTNDMPPTFFKWIFQKKFLIAPLVIMCLNLRLSQLSTVSLTDIISPRRVLKSRVKSSFLSFISGGHVGGGKHQRGRLRTFEILLFTPKRTSTL